MLHLGVFGINSGGLNTAVKLLILFLVVIWLALVYYTYADARRRIEDPMLIGCATLASFFPYVGTIIYMIVRPAEYLDDVRERDLEMAAAEARIQRLDYFLCPHCDYQVEKDFIRCPSCTRKLKDPCVTCAKPLDPEWNLCPYCETEVARQKSAPSRRRRRREEEPSTAPPATTAAATRAGATRAAAHDGGSGSEQGVTAEQRAAAEQRVAARAAQRQTKR